MSEIQKMRGTLLSSNPKIINNEHASYNDNFKFDHKYKLPDGSEFNAIAQSPAKDRKWKTGVEYTFDLKQIKDFNNIHNIKMVEENNNANNRMKLFNPEDPEKRAFIIAQSSIGNAIYLMQATYQPSRLVELNDNGRDALLTELYKVADRISRAAYAIANNRLNADKKTT
jgi:hypothetical protein